MSTEFRRLLEDGDFNGLRRAWHKVAPGMPQPQSDEQAEISMHMARTAAGSIAFRFRAYSHRWLEERNYPSQLPDILKPSADRLYPRVVEGVGVSVNFTSEYLKPAAEEVRGAMNEAIEDCYANGETSPEFVQKRMFQAKDRAMRQLFGRFGK